MVKELLKRDTPEVLGDGQAVFLSDMNEEEAEQYDYEVKKGWKGFLKKLPGYERESRKT